MKAYDVDRGVKIVVCGNIMSPPESIGVQSKEELTVIRLDGMYVSATNKNGETVYIHACTDVELIKE